MAGTVSLNGLVSGYDTQSIINALVSVASSNLRNMESDLTVQRTRLKLYQTFNGLVDDLNSAITGINSINELTALAATSSNESVLTASISGDSFPGSYQILVNNLAIAETSTSQGFADPSDTIGTGDIEITIGSGDPQTISIDGSNNTLEGVAAEINAQASGVTAYVINTGVGANPYKLMITSEDTGTEAAFTIDPGTTSLVFTETVSAEDADIEVNGESIVSGSNTISDIVPGVTLDLLSVSATEVTLTVNRDLEGIQANIQGFVDAYNEVMEFINEQFDYNESTGAGVLSGDSTLRYIQRSIQQVVGSTFNSSNDIQSLSMMGIKTESDGSLSINSTELLDALSENYAESMDLFTGEDAFLSTLEGRLDIFLDSVDGTLKTKTDSIESIIETLEDSIVDEQDRIDQLEERLIQQFARMESILSQFNSTEQYLDALFTVQNKKK